MNRSEIGCEEADERHYSTSDESDNNLKVALEVYDGLSGDWLIHMRCGSDRMYSSTIKFDGPTRENLVLMNSPADLDIFNEVYSCSYDARSTVQITFHSDDYPNLNILDETASINMKYKHKTEIWVTFGNEAKGLYLDIPSLYELWGQVGATYSTSANSDAGAEDGGLESIGCEITRGTKM